MNAMIIRSFGGPEVLQPADLPRPEPRDGEVLIHVHAAGVNPIDYKIRSGGYAKQNTRLPAVLGRDVSGIVEAVGSNVTSYKHGDEVYAFLGANSGGYAEYAVAKESEMAAKPESLDHVHAAAVPLAAVTAWQALFDEGKLEAGQRVLIHGAAGGVGHFAVQFAKAKGAHVVATCGPEDIGFVRGLGADEVIDHRHEDFVKRAANVDLVIDLVAGETQEKSWNVLRSGGTMVSTLQQPSEEKARAHHAQGKVFMAKPRHDELVAIAQLIDDGKVRVCLQHTHPLHEAPRAHEELENEHAMGKTVLTVP
ncbi:MAG TPA: NADP-dependent oxidoreductase [Opitutaceae bacterium]|nr:NADP-dependent oxidoreductase [Opitutaceae bacterium]